MIWARYWGARTTHGVHQPPRSCLCVAPSAARSQRVGRLPMPAGPSARPASRFKLIPFEGSPCLSQRVE
eukprot:754147-Prymnesium_polylepis.1